MKLPAFACDELPVEIKSPDQSFEVQFCLQQTTPTYSVNSGQTNIIRWSKLGLRFESQKSLENGFRIQNVSQKSQNLVWEQPWGEERYIRDHFNETTISLVETGPLPRSMILIFRAYNDGIAFRYFLPNQQWISQLNITEELTEFNFAADPASWWIPAYDHSVYENLYRHTYVKEIPSAVHTPITLKQNQFYLSIHEAALINYSSMQLKPNSSGGFTADLTAWSDGVFRDKNIKVKTQTPMQTPWRTIQIARRPGDLITSYLILNLNEPNKIGDTSWIRTGKFLGIWWGMHIEKFTWGASPVRGATTKNVIKYIDDAVRLKIPALLIEGWNAGWDGDWFQGTDFQFTTPNPELDFEYISNYARSQGVELIGHHETAGAISHYEAQADEAFQFYRQHQIQNVKTGYVGTKVQNGEYHYGQFMVNHQQWVTEIALKNKITLNVHEGVKDTGLRRTYPNLMTREAVRGTEYDAWSNGYGNPPSHTTTLPFTRGLSGPMDFTPGIFDLLISQKSGHDRINTTLAKQLALFVVLYSPWQMIADLPESYDNHPAFQFLQDVPTDWETTKVLGGEIGEYITAVRKDRRSEDWYLGSITDEQPRDLNISLSFLNPLQIYCAEIYQDRADSDWQTNPLAYEIKTLPVRSTDRMALHLAPGGGQAIRFKANYTQCSE